MTDRLNRLTNQAVHVNPDQTRSRILSAADQLLGEVGFDAMSTRDIADRSGVNKALIHYHYGSKDELLTAILDGYYDQLSAVMGAAIAKRRRPREQVEDAIDAYSDFLAEHRTFCSVVQREIASGRHVEQIVARTLPMFQLGSQWLKQRAPHPPEGFEAVQVLTTVYGLVVAWFAYGRVLERLTGEDPFSPRALGARRRHVHAVVSLLFKPLNRRP